MKDIIEKLMLIENQDIEDINYLNNQSYVAQDFFDDDIDFTDDLLNDISELKEKILDMQSETISDQKGFSEAVIRIIHLIEVLEDKYHRGNNDY